MIHNTDDLEGVAGSDLPRLERLNASFLFGVIY
jgi:hypothetical protein